MKWSAVLARFGFTTPRLRSPQTLAAAGRRQREALEAARTALDSLAALEPSLPAAAAANSKTERLRLEALGERLRMRVEFFRADRLSAGSGFVHAASTSRAGDTLGDLTAETVALLRAAEVARERAGDLLGE